MTAGMLAEKQPSFKKCVIAYRSSIHAPIMIGSKRYTEAAGSTFGWSGRRAFQNSERYRKEPWRVLEVIMPG